MAAWLVTEENLETLIPDAEERMDFIKRLVELKKEESPDEGGSGWQSTWLTSRKGKRKLDSEPLSNPRKKLRDASRTPEDDDSKAVKKEMDEVMKKLKDPKNDIETFLRESIEGLKGDRNEIIGVFGKTGAGKSSLINAIIGEKDLLPTGSMEACTSVIIKVKANTENQKYIGKVKFISEEDFNNELDFLKPYFGDDAEEEREDCDPDYKSKLMALFGDEWKNKSLDSLKRESRRYKEIIKTLEKKTVEFSYPESKKQKLCEDLKRYTKEVSEDDESEDERIKTKTWYWPVVKNVTIKVPNNELLRHVTLVDLPGNGDCNKTRNEMWKKMVSNCGTVWVVTEVNRAASELEAWEILESACKHMGHGGQCRMIHFICTKLDIEKQSRPRETTVADIVNQVKKKVEKKRTDYKEFERHFTKDSFDVCAVSAQEYFKNESLLTPEETGIPKLQDFIKKLNSQQERASRYVSAAYGILSLMEGARTQNVLEKAVLHKILSTNLKSGVEKIKNTISGWYKDFDQSLAEGVTKAKASCEEKMKIKITDKKHHMTLKSVVKKNGVHITMKGKEINLNTTLSSFLTEPIDDLFRKVFSNEQKVDSFWEIIQAFSLNTKGLLKDYQYLQLSLRFLQQEEVKLKRNLCQEILNRKKTIYSCLTETVQSEMQPCYKEAKALKGKDSLVNMRYIIMQHLKEKKCTMFDQAKDEMLEKLKELENFVKENLEVQMDKVINLSLSHDAGLPEVSDEFSQVERFYNKLVPKENQGLPHVTD